ncbi:hypothetical protein HRW07_26610 [Streptomyces lunaelactis]|nr:hypothetical protein [Streptomyces lunaelactis]
MVAPAQHLVADLVRRPVDVTDHDLGAVEVRSAGSVPGDQVNPSAVTAMAELGIDISDLKPKILTPEATQASEYIITMPASMVRSYL